jgi:hypothetical protein
MTRLEKLKELEADLKELMSKANSRSYAALCRQYRETIKEIEEIEGTDNGEDEIAKLISECSDGQSRAVRPNRSQV